MGHLVYRGVCVCVLMRLLRLFFVGQRKNEDQKVNQSSRARGDPVHGLLRQEPDRRVQESEALQEYPFPSSFLSLERSLFVLKFLFCAVSVCWSSM